jgi:hypothetical protein
MLESCYSRELAANTARAQCLVTLPEEWKQIESQRGMSCPIHDDRRRFVRSYCPMQVLMELRQVLHAVERAHAFYIVHMKDVSRGGLAFFHHAQMFPGERPTLWLPTGKRVCTVKRCFRRNPRCFEIGVSFETE